MTATMDTSADNEPIKLRSRLHGHMLQWTHHWSFNGAVILTIAVNAIVLAIETTDNLDSWTLLAIKVLNDIFLAVYTIEFFVKIYVDPTGYWKNGFNLFDFIVLIFTWVDFAVTVSASSQNSSQFGFVKVLRILRLLRVLRTISFIQSLQVIVTALMTTIREYMLNLMVVLFLIMFIFGVMAFYLYAPYSDKFASLGQSMLALVTLVTTDNWTEIEADIDSQPSARWFCVIFTFIGSYIFTNVFVSIVIVNLTDATQAYIDADRAQRKQIVADKTIAMNQKQKEEAVSFRLFLEQDRRAKFANYEQLLKSVEGLLQHAEKPEERVLCGDTSLNLLFVQQFVSVLDLIDNETYIQRNLYREMGNLLGLVVEQKLMNQTFTEPSKKE
ncbi:cation channel sperm-associated protein 3-like [Paramacrobiotus metropolitanus]|uniref:cation channel sperm-associated protein 3-like n=1 Tax=Paramacrobiotus metropolitanus TaxID=2943436 RepID=UPI002445A0FE|nr:cation channel sperm-associated protein 3-like [Paramacrobiotus metropolitanus]XP_055338644.1 cation channel sperm-associated protein 3-like [Paramacrobiotus metropolitanus]